MENLLGILGKIGFNWQIALANLFNFLIILFLLKKYAFQPIKKVINERQMKIQKGLEDAENAEKELTLATEKSESILHKAKIDANQAFMASEEDGKEIIKEAKAKAKTEREEILRQAKIDAEKEKKSIENEVKKETALLVSQSVKKIIDGYVEKGKGEDIINAMLSGDLRGDMSLKK